MNPDHLVATIFILSPTIWLIGFVAYHLYTNRSSK